MLHALFPVHSTLQSLTQPPIPLCREEGCFSIMAPLVPVNMKYLICDLYNLKPPHIYVGGERNHADLALLARLTQLKNMTLNWLPTPPTQPLPQLPAFLSLCLHMHRHM